MRKNNIYKSIIAFCGLFLAFLWLFSIKGHCAQEQDYFPIINNKNGHFSQELIDNLNTRFDAENNYVIVNYAYYNPNSGYGRYYYNYVYWPKNSDGGFFGEKHNNLYQFNLYTIGTVNFTQGTFWTDRRYPNNIEGVSGNNQTPSWFYGLYSSNYNTDIDYITNYKVLTNNTSSAQVVIYFSYPPEYVDYDNDTYPENFDQPDINDYVNNAEIPTFDNTDLQSAVSSIWSILQYQFSTLLPNLLNFVIDSLNWALQKVINNIRNFITELQEVVDDFSQMVNGFLSDIQDLISDLKDAFVEFKEGFEEFADLFLHPFDEEEFEEQIENSSFLSAYNELKDNSDILNEMFANAQERDHFSLYISFENPFADSEHKIIASEINFDWLVPLRSVYRPFLWICICFELFMGGARVLSSVIGGKVK